MPARLGMVGKDTSGGWGSDGPGPLLRPPYSPDVLGSQQTNLIGGVMF